MDILDGSHIQASGRLYGDKEFRIFINFPCNDRFLLVTSGHGAHLCDRSLAGADIILFDQTVCIFSDLFSL